MVERKERWFTIILTAVGAAGFVYSLSMPLMGPAALCPGLFPGFVTLLIVVLGIVRLIPLIPGKQKSAADYDKKNGEPRDESENIGKRSSLIVTGLFVGYLLLLVYIHFLASTIIFLCGSMLFLYKKFYWKIPLISIITAVGVYYLFRYLLNVRLP